MFATDNTRATLTDFNSMKGGSVFDATQVDSLDNETLERNPFGKGHNLRSVRDPSGFTRATPDPNTMAKPCVVPCAQNGSKVKVLRCKDFGVEESFRKSYKHLSLPKIGFSALASSTRLKGKGVNLTNAKSDLSYEVNT